MTNDEIIARVSFVIRAASLFRHSSFGIRHLAAQRQ